MIRIFLVHHQVPSWVILSFQEHLNVWECCLIQCLLSQLVLVNMAWVYRLIENFLCVLNELGWRKVVQVRKSRTMNLSAVLCHSTRSHWLITRGSVIWSLKQVLWLLILNVCTVHVHVNIAARCLKPSTRGRKAIVTHLLELACLKWRYRCTHIFCWKYNYN